MAEEPRIPFMPLPDMTEPLRLLTEAENRLLTEFGSRVHVPATVLSPAEIDLIAFGISITPDGERISPLDFYIDPSDTK